MSMRTESKIEWSLVVAVNSKDVLYQNLLAGREHALAKEIFIEENSPSASHAYNSGLRKCSGDLVVFAHQDVYLPPGWAEQFSTVILELTKADADWGVAGLYGVTNYGQGKGYVYSSGLKRFVGSPISKPVPVRTLDEMILIFRKSTNLRFDERLPGFHLYGTDICLEAESRGMKNYVLPCFALHNSNGIRYLPKSFWQAYLYLRRKWKDRLPIATPCTQITRFCMPMFKAIVLAAVRRTRVQDSPGTRVNNPSQFYYEHLLHTMKRQ